jgi:TonB family protein
MIRTIFASLVALSLAPALKADMPVDFESAMSAYENERYEMARTAFERMARAGLIEAQFNLGVMQLYGQGGSRDTVTGTAWLLLAAHYEHEAARNAEQVLRQQLGEDHMAKAEYRLEALKRDHGREELVVRHRPRPCSENCADNDDQARILDQWPELADDPNVRLLGGKPVRMHRQAPRYPQYAATRGEMGVVRLGGWINANGRFEHPHVVSADPAGTFDREALATISQWRYEWIDGTPDNLPIYKTQEISFIVEADGGPTLHELGESARAADENPTAAHRFIWLVENLNLGDRLEQPLTNESVVTIIHRSAMAGVPAAQIDLGRRLQQGNGVEQDLESATFWLQQAAFEGDAEAQFDLSRSQRSLDADYRRDLQRAAARSGMLGAIIAEIRTQVGDPDYAEPELLSELVDRLPSRLRDDRDDELIARARQLIDSA